MRGWRCRAHSPHKRGKFLRSQPINFSMAPLCTRTGIGSTISALALVGADWLLLKTLTRGRDVPGSVGGRRHRSETCKNRGSRGATDKPSVGPWAQEVVPRETGLLRVAADAPSAARTPSHYTPAALNFLRHWQWTLQH